MTKHGVRVRQHACEAFIGQGFETGFAADFNRGSLETGFYASTKVGCFGAIARDRPDQGGERSDRTIY